MNPIHRREFLENSLALTAGFAALAAIDSPYLLADDKPAPAKPETGSKLRVAVVGVRGRGMSHVAAFNGRNNCKIVAICDADEGVISSAMKAVEKVEGTPPKFYQDIRKLLEDKSIDVVSIATPNHWHALAAIWAMRAGKDVYVEKPVSHNVLEGRRMVQAARHYERICQAGTQSRSMSGMRSAIEHIHTGRIGKVSLAYGTCFKRRGSIGLVTAEQPLPKGVDYDLWCGPAPVTPLMRKSLHYDWHWTYTYGNGDLGNQGIHEMDKARWGLNKNALPNSAVSVGGRFGYVDNGETANTQLSLFDYGDSELMFEVRGLPTTSPHASFPGKKGDNFVGNIWFGSDGLVICPSYSGGVAVDRGGEVVQTFKGGSDTAHFDNFIAAVRSRKAEGLQGDIEEGHLSSALCHLGNISLFRGEKKLLSELSIAGKSKVVADSMTAMVAHLKDNSVDASKTQALAGALLTIDPKTEQFTGESAKANPLLTREYRKGFEVGTIV